MKPSVTLCALVLLAGLLAGCSGSDDPPAPGATGPPQLGAGEGAITGLVIDDRYRPVPNALVLLRSTTFTATTDAQGQFQMGPLPPGPYLAIVQVDGHEAAPKNIDVQAGQYTEVEVMARRLFSEGAYTVTTEYSVFIPCAVDFIVNGYVLDCTGDQSGDTFRATFRSDYTRHGKNASYLVTEMLANKEGRYEVQARCDTSGKYYAVSRINSNYSRMTMKLDNVTPDAPVPPEYGGDNKWDNKCKALDTILFTDSQFREELQGAGAPVCCGLGFQAGIKARFIQTLFLGPPSVDVTSYGVLKPNG